MSFGRSGQSTRPLAPNFRRGVFSAIYWDSGEVDAEGVGASGPRDRAEHNSVDPKRHSVGATCLFAQAASDPPNCTLS